MAVPFPDRSRARRLLWLLLTVWVMNLFDLILTLTAWQQNFMVELNPLAAKILPHGTAAIVIYKLSLLGLGTAVLWHCRNHWATEPVVWAYVILCLGLSLWWHKLMKDLNYSWAEYHPPARVYYPHSPHPGAPR
jgi:hypothetical protein